MALYRCAACGSPNIVTDLENDGIKYDYVKGAIGTAVLGVGGAVAGISNKSKMVFKCRDCGVSLGYSLNEPYKTLIDTGVASMAGRQTLNINGFPISWETIKSKYPNIESGQADSEIQENIINRRQNKAYTVDYLILSWEIDSKFDEKFLQKSEAEIEAEQGEWENNKKKLESQREEHFQNALVEKNSQILLLNRKKVENLTEISSQVDGIEEEIKQLQDRYSKLGVFSIGEKSNLKKQIAQNTEKMESLKAELSKKEAECDREIQKLEREIKMFQQELNKKLDIIYAIPESPKARFARLKEEQIALKQGKWKTSQYYFYIQKYFPQALSCYGKATENEIESIFIEFFKKMLNVDSCYLGATAISKARRYYEPFLETSMEGHITDNIGTIKKMGTTYYEYIGI